MKGIASPQWLGLSLIGFIVLPTLAGRYVRFLHNADGGQGIASMPDSGRSLAELPQFSPCDVIVAFEPNASEEGKANVLLQNGCSIVRTCHATGIHLVRLPSGQSVDETIARLRTCADVNYAEVNGYVYSTFFPNDPLYWLQWNLQNPDNGGIRMEKAWDIARGDPNVIVAVLDTGVAFEDFGRYRMAPELAGVSFVPGYDFVNGDDHPNDDQGHGTHITGTIVGGTDNSLGVAGVAFGCSIMPVKVMDREGSGDHFAVAEGIRFAVEHGAKVINMSFGSSLGTRTLRAAVAWAHGQGVTGGCAAGNDFRNGNPTIYPAGYSEYGIAVGATRFDLQRASYSSTGFFVDVVAPGGDTRVDQNGDGYPDGILQQTFSGNPAEFAYWYMQGTSMATPHVSGLAALLVSQGVAEPDRVAEAIQNTARDLGTVGWDPEYGWGIIDASAALAYFGNDGERPGP